MGNVLGPKGVCRWVERVMGTELMRLRDLGRRVQRGRFARASADE